jgi:hypothetical protein
MCWLTPSVGAKNKKSRGLPGVSPLKRGPRKEAVGGPTAVVARTGRAEYERLIGYQLVNRVGAPRTCCKRELAGTDADTVLTREGPKLSEGDAKSDS